MEINDIQYELLDDIVKKVRLYETGVVLTSLLKVLKDIKMPELEIVIELIESIAKYIEPFIMNRNQDKLLEKLGYDNGNK
jgi:hypothetical protein